MLEEWELFAPQPPQKDNKTSEVHLYNKGVR